MIDQPARVDVSQTGINRLAHIHLIGEIVPARSLWKSIDKAPRFGLDIGRICHDSKIAPGFVVGKPAQSTHARRVRLNAPEFSCVVQLQSATHSKEPPTRYGLNPRTSERRHLQVLVREPLQDLVLL